jgi:hypothetical protein
MLDTGFWILDEETILYLNISSIKPPESSIGSFQATKPLLKELVGLRRSFAILLFCGHHEGPVPILAGRADLKVFAAAQHGLAWAIEGVS